jgi:hypothetical protein
MKKLPYSPLYLFTRFMLLINIVFLIIAASFLILYLQNLISHVQNVQHQEFLKSLTDMIFWLGGGMILLNLFLFFLMIIYDKQKYFRMMEKINFENKENSLLILKNLNTMDEFGFMGQKLKKLLKIYLHFSHVKKLRVQFEQSKINLLLELLDDAAMLIFHEPENETYRVRSLNQKSMNMLKLGDKRSILAGKNFTEILDGASRESFLKFIESLRGDKNQKVYYEPFHQELGIQVNLEEMAKLSLETEKKEFQFQYAKFAIDIYPFVFQWPNEVDTENGTEQGEKLKVAEAPNSVIDSLLLIFKEKKGFWRT